MNSIGHCFEEDNHCNKCILRCWFRHYTQMQDIVANTNLCIGWTLLWWNHRRCIPFRLKIIFVRVHFWNFLPIESIRRTFRKYHCPTNNNLYKNILCYCQKNSDRFPIWYIQGCFREKYIFRLLSGFLYRGLLSCSLQKLLFQPCNRNTKSEE